MTTHKGLDEEELLVHTWRVDRLTRLGVPGSLAEVYADHLDWHQVARLVQGGCPRGWLCASPCDERTCEVARTGRRSLATWDRQSLFSLIAGEDGERRLALPPGSAMYRAPPSVLALADDGSLSSLTIQDPVGAPVKALNPRRRLSWDLSGRSPAS